MGLADEVGSVAEHGLYTLEKLVDDGDLDLARITFEMIGENVDLCCDAGQRERLESIRAALNEVARPRGP